MSPTPFLSTQRTFALPRTFPVRISRSAPHASQARPNQSSASNNRDDDTNTTDWKEDLRLLLDPTLNTSARQVLLQDLAKRAPNTLNDFLNSSCISRNTKGVSDVARQITDDVLPDLLANGPRYVASAINNATTGKSDFSSGASFPSPTSLSLEDVSREFRNVFNRTPEGLFTPEYRVLLNAQTYEIRQYPSLIIAETAMRKDQDVASVSSTTEFESAAAMGRSFNNLAGYLFGNNIEKKEMKMTTPVMVSKGTSDEDKECLSFIIGEYATVDDVPKTTNDSIDIREEPGRIYAVSEFSGFATKGEISRQREKLLTLLSQDNIQLTEYGKKNYKCMIYNGPSTIPSLRRNELMIEVKDINTEANTED